MMLDIQGYLSRLTEAILIPEEHDAIVAEIAALGEAVIPDLISTIRGKERAYSFIKALVQIGQASTLPLLEIFLDDISEDFSIRSSITRALGELQDVRLVEPLLQVIKDGDSVRSSDAVSILCKIEDERIVPAMINILSDAAPDTARGYAIRLLGYFKVVEASEFIAPYIDNDDLHLTALMALYRIGDERSIEPLKTILLNEDERFRLGLALVHLIGERPDKRFFTILLEMLEHITNNYYELVRDDTIYVYEITNALLATLGEFKDDRAVDLLMHIVNVGEPNPDYAVKSIVEIGTDYAVEQLINKLGQGFAYWDEYRMGHNRIIEAVASLGEKAVPMLIEIVSSKEESINHRIAATEALCEIGDRRATNLFLELFDDLDAVRIMCDSSVAYRLRKLNDVRLLPAIIKQLKAGNMTADHIVSALATYATTYELIDLLKENSESVRRAAILALRTPNKTEAVEPLLELLQQEQHLSEIVETLRIIGDAIATEALVQKIGKVYSAGKSAVEVGGNRAIPLLLNRLQEDNDEVRIGAAIGLAKWGDKNNADAIFDAFEKMTSPQSRVDILDSLATLQDERAVEPLIAYVYDEPENRKGHAIRALGYFRNSRVAQKLSDILLSLPTYSHRRVLAEDIINILKRHEQISFNALLNCLQHSDPRVKFEVISAISISINKEQAIQALTPLLEDTKLVPNYNFNGLEIRVCDITAYKLKDYNIPRAQEIYDDWRANE